MDVSLMKSSFLPVPQDDAAMMARGSSRQELFMAGLKAALCSYCLVKDFDCSRVYIGKSPFSALGSCYFILTDASDHPYSFSSGDFEKVGKVLVFPSRDIMPGSLDDRRPGLVFIYIICCYREAYCLSFSILVDSGVSHPSDDFDSVELFHFHIDVKVDFACGPSARGVLTREQSKGV